MNKFEQLNKDLIDVGFKIEDNMYILDKVTYQTISMNGRQFQQPQHSVLKMEYIGEGCEVDDSDEVIEGTEFYEFGIFNGDESVVTICISNIDELKEFVDV